MIDKNDLLDKVAKLPTFEIKDLYTEKEGEYFKDARLKGVTEQDSHRVIAAVTKKYKLVQFGDVYKPLVEHYENVRGELFYYFGSSVCVLFPEGEDFRTNDGKQIGLVVGNSVNKVMAITLNFAVLQNGVYAVVPNLSGFRQIHLGDVKSIVTDYEGFLTDIKESWKTITERFSRKLQEGDVANILAQVGMGKKLNKQLSESFAVYEHLTLWDFFMVLIKKISGKKCKREENKVRKLKRVSDVVYEYALMEQI